MTDTEAVSGALASMLSTCATCRSWAEQDEGPYHRDAQPLRRDIVGVGNGGAPVADATVEIWQCDALGRYSGFPPPDDSVVVTAAEAPRGGCSASSRLPRR